MIFKFLNSSWLCAGSPFFIARKTLNMCFPAYLKVEFSSKTNSDDDLSSESKIKKLLESSSPLKPTPEALKHWASTPHPIGTVFQHEDDFNTKVNPAPEHTSVIMFPGQGNQFVGMAKNLIKYPVVKDMFNAANDILGYNLLKICTEGPEEKLNKTKYCQPAILVCSLAALEKLKDDSPWAINNCVATCGYSLGELAALVFAGCITFEKAVQLVKLRAQVMQACCEMTPGGMISVIYGPGSELSKAMMDANKYCQDKGIKNGHCSIASYLFPSCKVIAGHIEALNYLLQHGRTYRLRKLSKLAVSGAFHTYLMKDASIAFKHAIEDIKFNDPLVKVYSNVNAKPYRNVDDIRAKLPKQIFLPVKWEQTMHQIYERPVGQMFPMTYECGPGNSLSMVLKLINVKASETCFSVKI